MKNYYRPSNIGLGIMYNGIVILKLNFISKNFNKNFGSTKKKDKNRSDLEKMIRREMSKRGDSAQVPREVTKALQGMFGVGASRVAHRAGQLVGRGDYSIRQPGAGYASKLKTNDLITFGEKMELRKGRQATTGFGSVHFSHKNTFASVVVPSVEGFAIQSYLVHAMNSDLFPMLAIYATMYEKVRFKQLILEYESTTSPMNSAGAMGTINLAYLENPDEIDYSDELEMQNSGRVVYGRPDRGMVYGVECKNSKWLYSQNSYVQGNNAIGNWAMGKLQVGVSVGSAFEAGQILGKLRVAYTVECEGVRIRPNTISDVGIVGLWRSTHVGSQPNLTNSGKTATILSSTLLGGTNTYSQKGLAKNILLEQVTLGKVKMHIPVAGMTLGTTCVLTIYAPGPATLDMWLDGSLTNGILNNNLTTSGPMTGIAKYGTVVTNAVWTGACGTNAMLVDYASSSGSFAGNRFMYTFYYTHNTTSDMTIDMPVPFYYLDSTVTASYVIELVIYDTGGDVPVADDLPVPI